MNVTHALAVNLLPRLQALAADPILAAANLKPLCETHRLYSPRQDYSALAVIDLLKRKLQYLIASPACASTEWSADFHDWKNSVEFVETIINDLAQLAKSTASHASQRESDPLAEAFPSKTPLSPGESRVSPGESRMSPGESRVSPTEPDLSPDEPIPSRTAPAQPSPKPTRTPPTRPPLPSFRAFSAVLDQLESRLKAAAPNDCEDSDSDDYDDCDDDDDGFDYDDDDNDDEEEEGNEQAPKFLAAAEAMEVHHSRTSPFNQLSAAQLDVISLMLESHPAWCVVKLLSEPPPRGMNLQTSKASLNRFRHRYEKLRRLAAEREAREVVRNSLQNPQPGAELAAASERLLDLRLLRTSADATSSFQEIRSIASALNALYRRSQQVRKQSPNVSQLNPSVPDES